MVGKLRRRIEANCLAHGLLYPWWVPVVGFAGQVVIVVIALALRDALWAPQPVTLTLLLVLVAPFVQIGLSRWLPWPLDALGAVVASTWLMWLPPDSGGSVLIDAAPALLAFATAETTARDGLRPGAVMAGLSFALIGFANAGPGVVAAPVHFLDIVLGFVIGAMLLYQMRALAAERRARERAWEQATAAERNRIAREIHDLVAHSLSVTLLHITGARHALRDVGESEADAADAVDEVDAALADAERVGRRAMADIRRTVSAIADGPEPRQSLPSAGDIAALVDELDAAGLDVEYAESGDASALPDAAGLGLYRIAQESLANVAKHAPGNVARVRLSFARGGARLTVSNPLAGVAPRRPGDDVGSGLAGMHARAEQLGATLTAGPVGEDWVVDVRLGSAFRGVELPCGRTIGTPAAATGAAT
ncbi:signal transduction histidine kinase [Nocardioides thalensis]|uniref:histidine kinase n=1 Tax=Nocardioides thalensis TaxID=1914755 RepID=A0A853CBX4_9ACTN|nr:histidine kinase [Nocardioides thalensis]NYJ03673.1 signal transduction histidine kinase [Nocardioides thalensis]